MPALRQPFEQSWLRGRKVGVGEAYGVEAELTTPIPDAPSENVVIHASRS